MTEHQALAGSEGGDQVQRRLTLAAGAPRGLAVDGDHALGHTAARGNPGGEAALELLGIKRGEDVTEMIVARGAVCERAKPVQQRDPGVAEQSDLRDMFGAGQRGWSGIAAISRRAGNRPSLADGGPRSP